MKYIKIEEKKFYDAFSEWIAKLNTLERLPPGMVNPIEHAYYKGVVDTHTWINLNKEKNDKPTSD